LIFWLYLLLILVPKEAQGNLSKLNAQGKNIVTESGVTVILRGFNVQTHTDAYQDAVYSTETGKWTYNGEGGEVELFSNIQAMNTWTVI